MIECSECGLEMERMYSKEYLDNHYHVKSPMDRDNMNLHIESKRLFKCSCGFIKRLNNKEYLKYIVDVKRGKK